LRNLVTVSHAVCVQLRGPKKFLARWYPVPLGKGAWLGQAVLASVGVPKFSETLGPRPLRWACLTL